ncbi:MAG: isomerase [Planctomycetota bacterium]|nr:MAG: isomerase [Planctomycetota bacterium]
MQLGYISNGLTHHRLDEALRLLADEGYDCVAISPDVGHLDPYRSSMAERASIARLLEQLGLSCVIESGARYLLDPRRKHRPNLLEAEAEQRAARLDFLRRCLELGEELGAQALSFWAGQRPASVAVASAEAHLREGIEALLVESERRSVPLAFEPEPGMLIETVAQARQLVQQLGDPPQLGLTIDLGHLYVTGEGSPSEVLPAVIERVRQIHIEDMRRGVHVHLDPGEGDVDFAEIGHCLRELNYQGPLCWELSRSAHSALTSLRKAKLCWDQHLSPANL